MNKNEMLSKRKELLDKAERAVNDSDMDSYKEIMEEVNKINERLEALTELEKRRAETAVPIERPDAPNADIGMSQAEVRQYSVLRAIQAAATGNWDNAGLEREASRAVSNLVGRDPQSFFVPFDVSMPAEARSMSVGTSADGGYLTDSQLAPGIIELLYNKLMVRAAGATVISGLVGDVDFTRVSAGASWYWVGEGSDVSSTQATLEQFTMAPHTIGGYTDLTRRLIKQSSIGAEMFARNQLANAVAIGIDYNALHGDGTGNSPVGIASTSGVGAVVGGTNGLAPTWSHIVQLETAVSVENADIGKLAYMTNPSVRGALKETEKASGTAQFVWGAGSNPLNGYQAYVTSQVRNDMDKGTSIGVCSGIFFGNWADLMIGLWGSLDILVDPYTGGKAGTVRVIAHQDVDIALQRPYSFAVMLDALTA